MTIALLTLLLGATLDCTVTRIIDGDGLIATDSQGVVHDIRLWGIDAPEYPRGKKRPKQPHGLESKEALSAIVLNKRVSIELKGRDGRDRELGTVWLGHLNVNRQLVVDGHARWFVKYAKLDKDLAAAEQVARAAGKGLWADKEPVAPWVWRAQEKSRRTPGKSKAAQTQRVLTDSFYHAPGLSGKQFLSGGPKQPICGTDPADPHTA